MEERERSRLKVQSFFSTPIECSLSSFSLFSSSLSLSVFSTLTSCSARSGTRASATRSAGEAMSSGWRVTRGRKKMADFLILGDDEEKSCPCYCSRNSPLLSF